MYEHGGKLLISWDGVDELFPVGMLDDMFSAFMDLLRQLASVETKQNYWQLPLPRNLPPEQFKIRETVTF